MQIFDFLPPCHDASSSSKSNIPPHRIEIPVVDDTDVVGLIRKSGELVAFEVMVVVCHCISEAAHNGFSDVLDWSAHKFQVRGVKLTFVLRLVRSRIPRNEILVIIWP